MSGFVKFDEAGHRRNFSLQVMEMTGTGEMIRVSIYVPIITAHKFVDDTLEHIHNT